MILERDKAYEAFMMACYDLEDAYREFTGIDDQATVIAHCRLVALCASQLAITIERGEGVAR